MTGSRAKRTLIGLSDQCVFSGLNFLLTVLVARSSSPADFGRFTVLLVSFLILSGTTRGLTSEPMVVAYSAAEIVAKRWAARAASGATFLVGLVFAVCGAALVPVVSGSMRSLTAAFALSLPALLLQDELRYVAFMYGRPGVALANDVGVAIAQIVGAAALLAAGRATPATLTVSWGIASVVGASIGCVLLRTTPSIQLARAWFTQHKNLAGRYGLDDLLNQASQQFSAYALAAIVGLSATAAVRGAIAAFGPVTVAYLGVLAAVVPELVRIRASRPELVRALPWRIGLAGGAFAILWGALVYVLPQKVGRAFFGQTWLIARPYIPLVAVIVLFAGLQVGYTAGLRALRAPRQSLNARLITTGVVLLAVLPGALIGGAKGAVYAMICCAPIQLFVWRQHFLTSLQRASSMPTLQDPSPASVEFNLRLMEFPLIVPALPQQEDARQDHSVADKSSSHRLTLAVGRHRGPPSSEGKIASRWPSAHRRTDTTPSQPRTALALFYIALAFLPWSAVQVAGIPLGDVPLALSLIALLPHAWHARVNLPASLWIGAFLIAVAGAWTAVNPPSISYLSSRYEVTQTFLATIGGTSRSVSNTASLLKYEVALVILPIVALLALNNRADSARRAASAWAGGIAVSCFVAFADHLGITSVGSALLGYSDVSGRQAGLTVQPNHLGVEAAMAIPVILYLSSSATLRRHRALTGMMFAGCLLGVYGSGSRGAAIGAPLAIVLSLMLSSHVRRQGKRFGVLLIAGLLYLLLANAGSGVLRALRLVGGSQSVSDTSRAMARSQGIADFKFSPLHGVGWGYANQAHIVYLQIAAAGGLTALVGFTVYVWGALSTFSSATTRAQLPVSAPLVASTVTWLIVGVVENQLTDQWVYVPMALLFAIRTASAPLSTSSASGSSKTIHNRRPSTPEPRARPRIDALSLSHSVKT